MGVAGLAEEGHGRYVKLRSKEEYGGRGSECRLSLHGRLVVVCPRSGWRMTWCAEEEGVSRLRTSPVRESKGEENKKVGLILRGPATKTNDR